VELFVDGSRVRDLFEQAKNKLPLFSLMSLMRLVEIARLMVFTATTSESSRLLTEMDGFAAAVRQ